MRSLLTHLYLGLTGLEREFFKLFRFLTYRPAARVIAIGNLTMGGTGKTPVLFELMSELKHHDLCVLTRGYRSPWERSFYHLVGKGPHPAEMTDEALLLNSRFPETPVLVGKNRHHSAIMAELMLKPELLLLDDGFQYRRLAKDLNLVLWDALADESEARPIPLGRMREPVWRLNEADAILLTRCESAGNEKIAFWRQWLSANAPGKPIIAVKTVCDGLLDHTGQKVDSEMLYPCLAFSAIGRPESFYNQLRSMGYQIDATLEFRDHHRFTADDLQKIFSTAQIKKLTVICTEKDACKIPAADAEKLQLHVLRIRTIPVSGRSFTEELRDHGIMICKRTREKSYFSRSNIS